MMETDIRAVEEDEGEDLKKDAQNIRMQEQFKNLQHRWNEYKSLNQQPKTYPPRHFKRSSNQLNASQLMLQINSPQNLMASLQQPDKLSSSSSTWKVRNNQLAMEEMRTERNAAMESGNWKGRRLSYDEELDMDFDAQEDQVFILNCLPDYGVAVVEETDQVIRSISDSSDSEKESGENTSSEGKEEAVCLNCPSSYSSASISSSSVAAASCFASGENEVEEEKATATVDEQRKIVENGRQPNLETRRKKSIVWVWVAVITTAVMTLISSLRILGFASYEEHHLVPT